MWIINEIFYRLSWKLSHLIITITNLLLSSSIWTFNRLALPSMASYNIRIPVAWKNVYISNYLWIMYMWSDPEELAVQYNIVGGFFDIYNINSSTTSAACFWVIGTRCIRKSDYIEEAQSIDWKSIQSRFPPPS